MSEHALEVIVGQMLTAAGLTIATAESCTGGLLASRLTDVAGSSAYLLGGIVAYSNEAKAKLLGVQRRTLASHGAVSSQVALEMARGARRVLGVDIGVSVTGIAGPAGGTAEKPVGLVYIALAAPDGDWCCRYRWGTDRLENKACSAEAALELICAYLEGRIDALGG